MTRRYAIRRPAARLRGVVRPIQEFIQAQASGGALLLAAALVALALANSPLAGVYHDLLATHLAISLGPWALDLSIEHWVNDGLMALFFLLVGLEIKREVIGGELADWRAAALPVCAAIGGALVPAAVYAALNAGRAGVDGWGIPMATDIAFTLGALALLGTRVPFALKVFVTAVAIVDDLIAVGVIALFYSTGVRPLALAVALGLVVAIWLAGRAGVRRPWFYLLAGIPVWLAVWQCGLHATLAGVLVALAVPALRPLRDEEVVEEVQDILGAYASPEPGESAAAAEERRQSALRALEAATEAAQSPLEKLEHMLETPVNYFIVPVFALANAGVHLSAGALSGDSARVALGVALGLVVGKPLGLYVASRLAVRAGLARLPDGVSWRQMLGAGILAGIGFTMAIFIANLAFPAEPELLDAAKLAILAASAIAGVVGVVFFMRGPAQPSQ